MCSFRSKSWYINVPLFHMDIWIYDVYFNIYVYIKLYLFFLHLLGIDFYNAQFYPKALALLKFHYIPFCFRHQWVEGICGFGIHLCGREWHGCGSCCMFPRCCPWLLFNALWAEIRFWFYNLQRGSAEALESSGKWQ